MENLYVQISLVDISDLDLAASRYSRVKDDLQEPWMALDALAREMRSPLFASRARLFSYVFTFL